MTNFFDTAVVGDATEAKHWKAFVIVVGLHNLPNVFDGRLILIVGPGRVKTIRTPLAPIRGCVIDGADHGDCPSRAQILQESWPLCKLELIDEKSCAASCREAYVPLFELIKRSDCVS